MPGLRSITVFDSDASNPYSEELVGVLSSGGIEVDFLAPVDHPLVLDEIGLRPRFRSSTLRSLVLEISSLLRLVRFASDISPVVVVWARPYQKIVLALLAMLRKSSVFYIVHNPEESRWPQGIRKRIEEMLLKSAQAIVHSESLRLRLLDFGPFPARVVIHPPYVEWQSRLGATHVRREVSGQGLNLLLLGRLEPDKFRSIDALISALDKLPCSATLRLLVRPAVTSLPSPNSLKLDDRSQNEWIDDTEIVESLLWADVLVAPYEAVTESGTVQLALTLGLRVVAFSGGALDQSLKPNALAKMGDFDDLAAKILEVTKTTSSTSKWSPQVRAAECLETWRVVLDRST